MFNYDENLIKITDYDVLGKLPDPFLKPDGTRITNPKEWAAQRKEMYKTAVELQYGTQPPKPEVFTVDTLYLGDKSQSYKITAGTKEKQVSFLMRIFKPILKEGEKCPVVVDGDMCFPYAFDKEFVETFTNNGIIYATFDRTELAHDIMREGRCKGALYPVYPEYGFGALGAWAWGYSRCVDALEQLSFIDTSCIAFTGHSRGAKTAALAGVLDERATIVNPNETCAGACGCYRIHMRADKEDGKNLGSETLARLLSNYDFWMGEGMQEYGEREQDLPFDAHFLKAMVAPRTLLVGEAASDIWANPVGSWQTSVAAKEVFKFLGCEENLIWYFRKGYHFHHLVDVQTLVAVILNKYKGTPLPDYLYKTPFKKPELIFDWKAPETK